MRKFKFSKKSGLGIDTLHYDKQIGVHAMNFIAGLGCSLMPVFSVSSAPVWILWQWNKYATLRSYLISKVGSHDKGIVFVPEGTHFPIGNPLLVCLIPILVFSKPKSVHIIVAAPMRCSRVIVQHDINSLATQHFYDRIHYLQWRFSNESGIGANPLGQSFRIIVLFGLFNYLTIYLPIAIGINYLNITAKRSIFKNGGRALHFHLNYKLWHCIMIYPFLKTCTNSLY
jgi:hypothetical protein